MCLPLAGLAVVIRFRVKHGLFEASPDPCDYLQEPAHIIFVPCGIEGDEIRGLGFHQVIQPVLQFIRIEAQTLHSPQTVSSKLSVVLDLKLQFTIPKGRSRERKRQGSGGFFAKIHLKSRPGGIGMLKRNSFLF